MSLTVREMPLEEVGLVIDYFHDSSEEHLAKMGVDRELLPARDDWRERYIAEYRRPLQQRSAVLVVWKQDGAAIGFSTAEKILIGEHAHMHLHIVEPGLRRCGLGSALVRQTVELYFDMLRLRRLFCEPNALNVAPNRTLQSVGFRYLMTYETIPGPLNREQAVTRWVLEGPSGAR